MEVAPPGAGEAVDLIRVRNEARQLRQTLPAGERVEVVFAPGVYWVTNTVTLFKADSRTLWRAAKPGKTHFRGGVEIPKSAFRAGVRKGVDVCAADVSALVAGELTDWPDSFRVPPGPWLYRNGKPLEIARYPNGSEWLTFENSVVAAGEAACVIIYFVKPSLYDGLIGNIAGWFSVVDRFRSFYLGIMDVSALVYYISVIFVFLFLTVMRIKKKRWS